VVEQASGCRAARAPAGCIQLVPSGPSVEPPPWCSNQTATSSPARRTWSLRPGLLHWYELDGVRDRVRADAADRHANAAETSLMLHLHPELVDLDAITDDPDRTAGLLLSYTVRETSRLGHTGSPSHATAAEGELLFETAAGELAAAFVRARGEEPPQLAG
jgi:creatinine amidohydrolase/Fe(II)-dependent formamide hydrolase-like protein